MRKECIIISPEAYNKLARSLRSLCSGRGVLAPVMGRLTQLTLGLITSAHSLKSSVTDAEAQQFLAIEEPAAPEPEAPLQPDNQQDYDDLVSICPLKFVPYSLSY